MGIKRQKDYSKFLWHRWKENYIGLIDAQFYMQCGSAETLTGRRVD